MTQIAYQIIASVDGQTDWDSGKVQSYQMTHILYGEAPASRTRVEWKVRPWDENDQPGNWSEPAYFEMGLLSPSD